MGPPDWGMGTRYSLHGDPFCPQRGRRGALDSVSPTIPLIPALPAYSLGSCYSPSRTAAPLLSRAALEPAGELDPQHVLLSGLSALSSAFFLPSLLDGRMGLHMSSSLHPSTCPASDAWQLLEWLMPSMCLPVAAGFPPLSSGYDPALTPGPAAPRYTLRTLQSFPSGTPADVRA